MRTHPPDATSAPGSRRPDAPPRLRPATALLLVATLACGPGDGPAPGSGGTAGPRDTAAPADAGGPGGAHRAPTPETPAYGIRVTTDRALYAPGDTIRMELEVFRRGGDPVTLYFATAQRHDFLLRGPESATTPAVAWRWSDGRFFAQSTDTVTLGPERPALTAAARHPAPGRPGRYRLEARVTASEWPLSATVPITVAP